MDNKVSNNRFLEKFAEVSSKIGNEVHLRSLRDAFAMIMPLFILAGVGVLINNVFFPLIASGETLTKLQVWGNLITNGTLNIAGLVLAPAIGYVLARNKGFKNPMAAAILAIAALVMTMPEKITLALVNSAKTSTVTGGLSLAPGIFNINEPVIFGFPIVFNIPMMIPFVLQPVIGILIAYFFTAIGWMHRVVVLVPWTTPPLLSGFLATGGDWRAVVVQLIIIVEGVFFYLPFLKVSEAVMLKNSK